MSQQDRFTPESALGTAAERLYLDEWIRKDISSSASNKIDAAKLRKLPFRQVVYYGIARRMAETLEHASKNSLHYAEKFKKNPGLTAIDETIRELRRISGPCLNACDLKTLGIIELEFGKFINSLPFTWPEELAAAPESFLAVSHSDVESITSQFTSGSTGACKRIFCSLRDQEATINFFINGMRYMVDTGKNDRVALMMSSGGKSQGNLAWLYTKAMQRLGVPCLVVSNPDDERRTLMELAEFGPTCIVGTPRQFYSTFRSRSDSIWPEADACIARIKSGLKDILLSGDRTSSAMHEVLSRELGVNILLHYGLVEAGMGTAVECRCHEGGHYRESDFFIEIIAPDGVSYPSPLPMRQTTYMDPDDLNCSLFGATPWGEITITSLTREANPLIRYRTGDIGRIIVDKCRCGSDVWRLEVLGRWNEFIQLPVASGERLSATPRLLPSNFDRCLLYLPWIKDYQVTAQLAEAGASTPQKIGIILLLNSAGPDDTQAVDEIRRALLPVQNCLKQHNIGLYVCLAHSKSEFTNFFAYGPKRLLAYTTDPFDEAVYHKL